MNIAQFLLSRFSLDPPHSCPPSNVLPVLVDTNDDNASVLAMSLEENGCRYKTLGKEFRGTKWSWDLKPSEIRSVIDQ